MKCFSEEDLNAKTRKAWKLYKSGKTYDEIAEELGISKKSAQSRINRFVPSDVINAFKPLNAKQKLVYHYVYELKMSVNDIALELGVTPSAISQMKSTIEKRLKAKENCKNFLE